MINLLHKDQSVHIWTDWDGPQLVVPPWVMDGRKGPSPDWSQRRCVKCGLVDYRTYDCDSGVMMMLARKIMPAYRIG